jgi:hypothetical protein
MDHDHSHFDAEEPPWLMGWGLALGAGLLAAVLTAYIGGASAMAGFVVGLVSFGVFGVLLGAGGVSRSAPIAANHDDHAAGHH